jgi:hypothetical protein
LAKKTNSLQASLPTRLFQKKIGQLLLILITYQSCLIPIRAMKIHQQQELASPRKTLRQKTAEAAY